jgi:hypothetical protein
LPRFTSSLFVLPHLISSIYLSLYSPACLPVSYLFIFYFILFYSPQTAVLPGEDEIARQRDLLREQREAQRDRTKQAAQAELG